MDRLGELVDYLESVDVSRLRRWGGLGYEDFCNAIDDYCAEGDYDNWSNLLRAIAKMVRAAMAGGERQ